MPRWIFRRKFVTTATCCGFCVAIFIVIFPLRHNESGRDRKSSARLEKTMKSIREKDQRHVIYNRVPKCGSMSMTTLCYRLGGSNNFRVASPYEEGEKPGRSAPEQEEFIRFILAQPPGYMYIRHQYFIDFTSRGHKQPLYINMIRDPIARFQSFYYFSRFGNERGGGGASARMSDERRHESIDECIQRRRQECVKPYWQVVPYFCGQEPGCMTRSQWSVARAKENIRNHFAFVGTLEDLDVSLRILEIILPDYFKNAEAIYHNPENERMKVETHTRKNQEPSEAAKDFLRTETSLKLEYELYDFVKKQLNDLKEALL